MTLKISPIQTNTRTIQMTLSGRLDSESAPALDRQIQTSMKPNVSIVILDMASLEMITSAGIGVITKAQSTLLRKGGELLMLNMQPQIKKVFEIVRLLPTLTVFENTQEMDDYLVKIQQRIKEEGSFDSGG
jgi:anti-anti-sigma factor